MKIIARNRLPLKYLREVCDLKSRCWNYYFEGCSKLNYWLSVLHCTTDRTERKCNSVYLALDFNGELIGFLLAYVSTKPKQWHPILFAIHTIVCFLLSMSKTGRGILTWKKLYAFHSDTTVELGKRALLGKDSKKISEGLTTAVDPGYRKSGIYKEMVRRLMTEIDGYFIFHTSTESIYQAHETLGFKKIYEVPYFYPEKETTFIMYGDKSMLGAI